MSKSKNFVLTILHVIAWVIFVGLSIEAGALIVNFAFALFKPEMVGNLYQKLDLAEMYERSRWAFYSMYSMAIVLSILKAALFYLVINMLSKLNLANPFSENTSRHIANVSHNALIIGIISYISQASANFLEKRDYSVDSLNQFWSDSQAFILMAAIVYVISAIFSKGVELRNESDLTV